MVDNVIAVRDIRKAFAGVQARFFQLSMIPASIRAGQRLSSMFAAATSCFSSRN